MHFDFEDYRPETPRVTAVVSVREGVLLSIIVHLGFVIALLLFPDALSPSPVSEVAAVAPDRAPLRFVEVMPFNDRMAPPIREADQSDLDRQSSTVERPPDADNPAPFMRGNSPELSEGGPRTPPPSAPPDASSPPSPDATPLPMDERSRVAAADLTRQSPLPQGQPAPDLQRSLRNLNQYLRDDQFDNSRGGLTDRSADIQFDSKGVDFGPWLRRFKNQVERNWYVPQAAMMYKTRVVVQFNVLRNGTITDLTVLEPAAIPALTNAAVTALKLSNPTAPLPPEYPTDKVLFTVSFWYNLNPRDFR